MVESCRISNTSEILWLPSIPARIKNEDASANKIICRFFRRSRAANSEASGGILPKFQLIQAFIVVLVTYKNKEDLIKNEGARVLIRLYVGFFFRRSRAANSEVSGGILPKFGPIQAFIVVLVTCKNEEDPIKNEGARVLTRFPHYKSMGVFFSDAQGQLTPQSLVESG